MGYIKTAKRYYASGKRKYRRAKVWFNTPQTPKALAIQALAATRKLQGLVNSEMMKVDYGAAPAVSSTTATALIPLTDVSVGDVDGNRTGSSIFVRVLNGSLAFEKATLATYTYVRYMVVIDSQQISDTAPVISDVLASDWESHLSKLTVGRFKVLCSGTASLNANYPQRMIKFNKVLRHHVRYNGNAGTDVQKGAIYLLLLSNEAINTPTVRYNIRMSYHDN